MPAEHRTKGQTSTMSTAIKSMIENLANRFGFEVRTLRDPVLDEDKTFQEIFAKCKPYTQTSKARMYCLYNAIGYLINRGVVGDFVECGVWRGGSLMVIALSLLKKGVNSRNIYAYDTFRGTTAPTSEDYQLFDGREASALYDRARRKDDRGWLTWISLSEVEANLATTHYPRERIIFVKGEVEKTIPQAAPDKIALLRLDTDWYASTKHELTHLFPRIAQNGVILIDDYGHWNGSKKAVDEYFASNGITILLSRIDYTGRIGVKS